MTPNSAEEGVVVVLGLILHQAEEDVQQGVKIGLIDPQTLTRRRKTAINRYSQSSPSESDSMEALSFLQGPDAMYLSHLIKAASGVMIHPEFLLRRIQRKAA